MHVSKYVSMYVCRYVCMHACMYVYIYMYIIMRIYIYICSPPPPRSTLRGSKAFALRTPSTYALERKTEREQERRREFITRKKDRENKQIRTCVPVLLKWWDGVNSCRSGFHYVCMSGRMPQIKVEI